MSRITVRRDRSVSVVNQRGPVRVVVSPQGPQGSLGPTGPHSGLDYLFDTGTTDADPGSGNLRFNHATLASATFMYISKTGRNGESLGSDIGRWDDTAGMHRGHGRVYDIADRTRFIEFDLETALTDGTTYWKVPLANVTGGATPSAGVVLDVFFARAGDAVSPTTTRGDIIRRGASADERLALGTSGYHLQSDGTDPVWAGFMQAGTGASTRTWQAKARDIVSVLDFGAVGDGDIANASVNATALTNALATGKTVLIPYTSAGYHFGTNQLTIGTGQYLLGENKVQLKSTAAGSDCFIRMTGFNQTSGLENVTIDMDGSGASSTAVRFGTSSGVVYRTRMSKLNFRNCVEAIGDEVHATNYVVDCMFEDIECVLTRGRQVYLRRSRGFMLFDAFIIDRTGDAGTVTWEGARLEDGIGIELNRFDVVGQVGTTAQALAYGLVMLNCTSVWMDRVLCDNSTGPGMLLQNVTNLIGKNVEVYQNLTSAVVMVSCDHVQVVNFFVEGGQGLTGAAAGAHGIYLETCDSVQFSNVRSRNNTAAGLFLNGSTNVQVNGNIVNDNGTFGVQEFGAADNNMILNAVATGNAAADYALLGTRSLVLARTVAGMRAITVAGKGVVSAEMASILAADRTGNDSATAQPVFGSAADEVTVAASTTYEFEAVYWITRAAGTTSHTTGVLFAGTATFTAIDYLAQVTNPTGNVLAAVQQIMAAAATETVLTAANTSATENLMIKLRGTMRVNAAGTIIPQFKYSAAPGGVPSVKRDSFFRMWPVGSSSVEISGRWS